MRKIGRTTWRWNRAYTAWYWYQVDRPGKFRYILAVLLTIASTIVVLLMLTSLELVWRLIVRHPLAGWYFLQTNMLLLVLLSSVSAMSFQRLGRRAVTTQNTVPSSDVHSSGWWR